MSTTERNTVSKMGGVAPTDKASRYELVVSQAGPLTVSASPPWRPRDPSVLSGLRVALGLAGSTETTVTVSMNGLVIVTVTIPAGEQVARAQPCWLVVGVSDTLLFAVAAAGTGAADLSMTAEFG